MLSGVAVFIESRRMYRTWIAANALLILLTICSCDLAKSGDVGMRDRCTGVLMERRMSGPLVVLEASAQACYDVDGKLLSYRDAVDRLGQVAWSSMRLPVDAIHVRVYRAFDADIAVPPASLQLSAASLKCRFGPGPMGITRPVLRRPDTQLLWFLLPIAYLAVAVTAVGIARRAQRSGLTVVLLRR
ncbi:hypothetical protein [Pseudonocardia alaniniphila]|uniref:Uncharacterized protein n=1 Tax=Pseudonocardia alaniniphila TaxID=75291 RepID=A0ABS9T9J4_9PSEU|nr:hypothetical protein [Pseudonocardia alaniniphila]MCH6165204.1 hypothetical protein [Pseudonocardia alaniniphila]